MDNHDQYEDLLRPRPSEDGDRWQYPNDYDYQPAAFGCRWTDVLLVLIGLASGIAVIVATLGWS